MNNERTQRLFLLLLCSAMVCLHGEASAQGFTRRALPGGAITGLELTLEGPQAVEAGQRARWFVALHEVVRDQAYRPASGANIQVLASYQHGEPVADITTDANGRAVIEFVVPVDVHNHFQLHIDARSAARGMRRRFELPVSIRSSYTMTLNSPVAQVQPFERFVVHGLLRGPRGRLIGDQDVIVQTQVNGRTHAPPQTVRTHEGAFVATIRAPRADDIRVTAQARMTVPPARAGEPAGTATVSASLGLRVQRVSLPRVAVQVQPARAVVRPGEIVDVAVAVFDNLGNPLDGARVGGVRFPSDVPEDERFALTDTRGRAVLRWQIPRDGSSSRTLQTTITATAPGIGNGQAAASVRVAGSSVVMRAAPEGGALIPGVVSRLFVRLVSPDGTPSVGTDVEVEAPRLGRWAGTTDAAGVAMLEGTLRAEGRDAPDACGGATALAIEVRALGQTREQCVAVDPDSLVRVRAVAESAAAESRGIDVAIAVAPEARALPLRMTLLRAEQLSSATHWIPVEDTILPAVGRGGEVRTRVADPSPPGSRTPLLVRVRPLVGEGRAEVRGGVARVVPPAVTASSRLELDGSRARVAGALRGFVVAADESSASALRERLPRLEQPSEPLRLARLANETPRDLSAPYILRGRALSPVPSVDDPTQFGLLRDPWRQMALYQSGRLALVLRAIEAHVMQLSAEGTIETVAERTGRGYRFHRALIDLIGSEEFGPEGARDLGGLPLTVAHLEAMDPAFTFDRMARRITRQRLLQVLVSLRDWVHTNNHDLDFARVGSPGEWLGIMLEDGELQEQQLRDGWGRPMVLREVRGRARFDLLQPVRGWELVSAGPDGRMGNADDVVDPTARVLPSGSMYGRAMDEDGLLARLNGVALGRATLAALSDAVDMEDTFGSAPAEAVLASFEDVPTPLPEPTPLRAPNVLRGDGFALEGGPGTFSLSPRPGTYRVFGAGYEQGRLVVHEAPLTWGGRVDVRVTFPRRLALHETLRVPVRVTRPFALDGSAVDPVEIDLRASSASVEVEGGHVSLSASEESKTTYLTLRATAAGRPQIEFQAVDAAGEVLFEVTRHVRVAEAGARRTRWASALVDSEWPIEFDLPEGATHRNIELVLVAPNRLDADPLLRPLRQSHPHLLAWNRVLAGVPLDEELRQGLSQAPADPIMAASALVAATALADDLSGWAGVARRSERAIGRIAQLSMTTEDNARILAALSPIAAGVPVDTDGSSRVEIFVDHLREQLWDASRLHAEDDHVLAQVAAALLMVDPADQSGRAFFQVVRQRLETRGDALVVVADTDRARVTATAAMALAAMQLGDEPLRQRLARGAAHRSWQVLLDASQAPTPPPQTRRRGRRGESTEPPPSLPERAFWLLAASSHGALGRAGTVRLDGQNVAIDGAVRRILEDRDEVRAEVDAEHAVWSRVEARYDLPVAEVQPEGGAVLSLEGVTGDLRGPAALEVKVVAGPAMTHPILAIQLPAGATLPEGALEAIRRNDAVASVGRIDRNGQVRIQLSPLPAGSEIRLPLPILWLASGRRSGLSLSLWDDVTPWQVSSIPARTIEIPD